MTRQEGRPFSSFWSQSTPWLYLGSNSSVKLLRPGERPSRRHPFSWRLGETFTSARRGKMPTARIQRTPNIHGAPKVEPSKEPLAKDIKMSNFSSLKHVSPAVLQEPSGRASSIFPMRHGPTAIVIHHNSPTAHATAQHCKARARATQPGRDNWRLDLQCPRPEEVTV